MLIVCGSGWHGRYGRVIGRRRRAPLLLHVDLELDLVRPATEPPVERFERRYDRRRHPVNLLAGIGPVAVLELLATPARAGLVTPDLL